MGNFFENVMDDLDKVQEDLLGPDYNYWEQINTPSEMGMSGAGNLNTLNKNVNGLIAYMQLLVQGGGNASKVDGPMGNKFFLKTGATCKDKDSGKKVDRYIYVNNVPDGRIPFISQGMGNMQFNEFRGLVPGALSNLNVLNPFAIFQSFMSGTNPTCQPLTMETIDADNNKTTETHHVTETDIKNIPPCWFQNNENPITKKPCLQTFGNMKDFNLYLNNSNKINTEIPDDIIAKLFYASLGGLGLYLLYKLMYNKK